MICPKMAMPRYGIARPESPTLWKSARPENAWYLCTKKPPSDGYGWVAHVAKTGVYWACFRGIPDMVSPHLRMLTDENGVRISRD